MTAPLKTTPLNALHRELGAKLVPFAGFEMPVSYPDGIIKEHMATREAVTVFDVSHMGQLEIRGDDVAARLEAVLPSDIQSLACGRQRYSFLTNDAGGVIDDLMVTRLPDRFFMVINASRIEVDVPYLWKALPDLDIRLLTDHTLLALQGPGAEAVLAKQCPQVTHMVFMDVIEAELHGEPCVISRSGYTGEDGFEISVPAAIAEALVREWLSQGVKPAGLGARDSLRLEAGLCLYGHELNEQRSPVSAGLNWAMQKVRRSGGERAGGFPGADRILREIAEGADPVRVGLLPEGRAPLREGTVLEDDAGKAIGIITSGTFSPTLQRPAACGYIDVAYQGASCIAQLRGKPVTIAITDPVLVPHRYKRS
ncbi:MAG TPA: glycine cleavage system aminomethyltransferase GcvT [Pseudomonadales bacterium]